MIITKIESLPQIGNPLFALYQIQVVHGKGNAGVTDRCIKLREMNNK